MDYTTSILSDYLISREIVLNDVILHRTLSLKEIVFLINEQVSRFSYGTAYVMNRKYECVPLSAAPETLEIDDF